MLIFDQEMNLGSLRGKKAPVLSAYGLYSKTEGCNVTKITIIFIGLPSQGHMVRKTLKIVPTHPMLPVTWGELGQWGELGRFLDNINIT